MLQTLKPIVSYLLPVAVVGILAHVALSAPNLQSINPFYKACAHPVTYAVQAYDERFGISREEYEVAVERAAAVWNAAAGKTLLASSTKPMVTVNLEYDERQQAIELGEEINQEHEEYADMRAEIDSLRARYRTLESQYERDAASLERSANAYESDVQMWNDRGGAPPQVYASLNARKEKLAQQQAALDRKGAELQAMVQDINAQVDTLNALVMDLNQSADTFNKTLGHDFDQGNYVEDAKDKRITIFTFEDTDELTRVLTHEFGHALGIGHVENPMSIMYSYDIGETLELSEEDRAALKEICGS